MNVELKGVEKVQNFNVEAVQEILAEAVKQISIEMVQALMAGLQEKLDFKGLAEKHIVATHKEDLSGSDEKIQMIFQKLFLATHEHIQTHSQPLVMTLAMIGQQTENSEAPGMFLSSFVLPKAKSTFEKLQAEQPESLNHKEIWV